MSVKLNGLVLSCRNVKGISKNNKAYDFYTGTFISDGSEFEYTSNKEITPDMTKVQTIEIQSGKINLK